MLSPQHPSNVMDHVVRHASNLEALDTIRDDSIEAVIWDRAAPPTVLSFLENMHFDQAEDMRFFVAPSEVSCHATQALNALGIPNCPVQSWLVNDIQMLATEMGRILSAPKLQVRLEVVDHNACKRFHRDNVKARLVCTYRGPGTDYGFAQIGHQPDVIDTVPTGQPILLKGKRWSKATDFALLHRSPQIEGSGITRLLVVIDDVSIPSPA